MLRLAVSAGNFSSFLFQLAPRVAVHPPSGANQNFQYCGHNFASLPNGIGFGGQVWHTVLRICISITCRLVHTFEHGFGGMLVTLQVVVLLQYYASLPSGPI